MSDKTAGFGLGTPPTDLTKGPRRKWTWMEKHILRALLLGCCNRVQVYRVYEWFGAVFEKTPAEIQRHIDRGERVDRNRRLALYEREMWRMIWGWVVNYRGTARDMLLEDHSREGRPITYGEGRMLRTWFDSQVKRGSLRDLAEVLGRETTETIEKTRQELPPEDHQAPGPLREKPEVEAVVQQLATIDLADADAAVVMPLWRKFVNLIEPAQ